MNCGKKISQKVALEGRGFEPNFSVKLTFSNQNFVVPWRVDISQTATTLAVVLC